MPQGGSLGVSILQGLAPQKPFDSLGQVQAISKMANDEQAAQRKAQGDRVLQQIQQQYANDPDEGVNELRRRGFANEATALEKHLGEIRTAKLKERGLELDNLNKEGTINEQMYKLEKAAIESDDPMNALRMIAHAGDQTQLDEARALVSFKYGPKAPHLLKVIPSQWTPDFQERMTQMVMGPEKMLGIEEKGLAREQAWDLAKADDTRADTQLTQTTAHQNRMATVAERNAGTNANRAAQTGAGGGGGATSSSEKAMVAAIMKNPQIYDTLTPTVKTRLAVPLSDAGFNFAQKVVNDGKPSNGMEKRALNFFNRAKQADEELANVEEMIAKSGTAAQFWRETMPNFLQTTAGQQYTAAQRAFTEARLRKDSGAAIPPQEFANDRQTYFVQAGDDAKTVQQKQRARAAMLASLSFESGRALAEFFGDDATAMVEGYKNRSKQPGSQKVTKEIPGFPGSLAESSDGGKTWKRIK